MSSIEGSDVQKVIIACDAGMGSSVMLAAQLAKRFKPYQVEVEHAPVYEIPHDAKLILCQQALLPRARKNAPDSAVLLAFHNFLGDPVFDRVEQAIRDGGSLES